MRILIAAVLAGLVVFCWGYVSHELLPLGRTSMQSMPGEDAVVAAMKQSIAKPGMYFFPGIDMSKKPTEQEQEAWLAKVKAGPTGLLVYHPEGGPGFSPKQMVIELVTNIIAAFIIAIVIVGLPPVFWTRVIAGMLFGLFAWFSISLSHWNWYGFTNAFTRVELIDQVGGWLLGGLVLAAIVPRKSAVSRT